MHHFEINGIAARDLADRYGTPLYVYDARKIRDNFMRVYQGMEKYSDNFQIFYAVKACNNPAIARLLIESGAGLDTASPNEILLAKFLGLPGERIMYTGNSLSDEDMTVGLREGVIFNLDDHSALPRLLAIGTPDILSLRINPSADDVATPGLTPFAGPSAKFGIHPHYIEETYRLAMQHGVKRFGVHMMPHSRVLDPREFQRMTGLLLDLIGPLARSLELPLEFIDIGGGLGIPYSPDEPTLDVDETARLITATVAEKSRQYGLGNLRIVMEPARYFVGNAGYLIGRVQSVKEGYRRIIGTDISMNTLARPVMYGAYHEVIIDGKAHEPASAAALTGQVCENTDLWIENRAFPDSVGPGDVVIVKDAGAYGYVMSYGYNGRLRPAEVLVDAGVARLITRRETFADSLHLACLDDDLESSLEKLQNS